MKLQPWMGIVVTLLIAGCQSTPPPTQAPVGPAGPEQIQRIRASYKAQDPKIEVGAVVDVMPGEQLVAVGDIAPSSFHEGQVVCFIDSTTAPLVCGKVVRITDSEVHVKYESPAAGRRAPVQGDIAVLFP